MLQKPFFSPNAGRRQAQGGQNLPYPSPNVQNLNGMNMEQLIAALRACGFTGDASAAAAAVGQQTPQRCRRTLMGLPSVTVPANAGAAGTLGAGISGTVNPQQYPFRGLRMIVPTEISAAGALTNLTVGVEPQLALNTPGANTVAGGVPLRAFDQTAHDVGFIDMDWASPTIAINYTIAGYFNATFGFVGALEGVQLI